MNVQSKSSICEPNIHGEQIYKMQFEVCFYHLLLNWDWYQSPKHFYAKDFFFTLEHIAKSLDTLFMRK